jgi:hypothetical protein
MPLPERRFAGIALTVLVHTALLLGWQLARRPPPEPPADGERSHIQWIRLQPALPQVRRPAPSRAVGSRRPAPERRGPVPSEAPSAALSATPSAAGEVAAAVTPSPAAAVPATGVEILQNARRQLGAIDRALRKENRPYIVAPPDSPQIRMRKGIEHAAEMAPNRLWEAPKVEELVNNTGDGARRTRVISGGGTYCVTDRSPATGIDMIEKHGKQRITNCPAHEEAAKPQAWRTAQDALIDAR